MLDRQALLTLSQYRNSERPIVSLYLTVDRNAPEDKYLIQMKNMMAEAEAQRDSLGAEQWQQVHADLERARDWVRENYVRGGQSVAIFACGAGLWKTFSLPYELPTALTLGSEARVRPLYRLLQRFERYLAILTDARDARVFLATPDETREVAQVEDDTPGRHDQGGWAQSRIQRHQDKMVEEHLSNAAELAFRLFQQEGFDGIVLMGTEERTSHLEALLHPYLLQRVLARVPMEMEASSREVGSKTMELGREQRRSRQTEQLDTWSNSLKGGNQGVAGLSDTLRAAQQGQLMTLIMREDLFMEGGRCKQCGVLTEQPNGNCDYCNGPIHHLEDVMEALTAAAIDQGAELIFLATDGGADRLNDYGGVGAT
ncbi:MAG: hypothetical protein H0T73_04215, partial [Ardenticatenales bacterium]|nr:hypothetical protein [Ardenticatenales bacterium]